MAKLFFGMNQSLDGYVDHDAFNGGPALFQHFTDMVRSLSGSIYGRELYEVMRYWDQDDPAWDAAQRDFAAAWRRQPKWVVSSSLTSVGPNATLISDNVEAAVARVKADLSGEIQVGGPMLAHSLAALIDEYRLYIHPVAVGRGKPFFAGPKPSLRFVRAEVIADDVLRLTYATA